MKKVGTTALVISILLINLFSFSGCITDKEAQEKFGVDSEYFIGLRLLSQGNEKQAINKLKKCEKKGTYYCARKSAETICTLGSVQEKNKAALDLYKKYNDSDSLLIAVKQLQSAKENHKIIEITNNIDFENEYNEIIKIRLEALKLQKDSRYEEEVFKWFTLKPISSFHYKFYRDIYDHPNFEQDFNLTVKDQQIFFTPQEFIINYRIETYNRNYLFTFRNAETVLNYFDSNIVPACEQLASDIGNAFLYGDGNYVENAQFLLQQANKYKNTPLEFYFLFFTGRLYDKADLYYTHAKRCFESAMSVAKSNEQKDRALWYLLNSSLNTSLESIEKSIGTYAKLWSDPDYFDDFFESLLTSLLAAGHWNSLKTIYKSIDGYASDETVGQFAYIYGRLVQEGMANGSHQDINDAFYRALNSGFSIYYKALASKQLGLTGKELEKVLCKSYGKKQKSPDLPAQILLSGYAYFGFPELIYPEWENLYKNGLSPETSLYISDFLRTCSSGNDEYYPQALRIASRIISENTEILPKEYWKPIYPKNYSDYIEDYSNRFGLIPSVVYALVRSESYFNPTVSSHAGAIGLAQLMESTGNDIARKLKKQEYSLTDPATNLEFGTFYLAELLGRCDNSYLTAFFSYNAGITRVRRWKNNSIIGFGKKANMPMDLFLETLPYAETREYGRKLISASIMYEWLYSQNPDKSFYEIIERLLL